MYKLSFKFSVLGIIALIAFGAAAVVLPQRPELAGGNSFHYSVLALIVVGVALVATTLFYSKGSFVHKYRMVLAIIAFSTLYGFIGNIFFNFWKWLPGGMLEFSYAQLGVMELGGLIVAMSFFRLEPMDTFAAGGLERLQKGKAHDPAAITNEPHTTVFQAAESAEDFMKSKAGLRGGVTASKSDLQAIVPPQEAVMPKKGGPSSLESAQAIMTPAVEIDLDASDEMLSGPLNPSPNAPVARTGSPASTPATPAGAKGVDATSNRLQAQKRRNTSTFTKLQALSASGTGSLKPTPVAQDSTGGGDLRSLLDRLDSEPEDVDYESLPTPEEIRVQILFSEETVSSKPAPKAFVGAKPQPLGQPKPAVPSKPTPTPATPAKPTPATAGGAGPTGQKPGDGKVGGLAGRMQQNKPTPPAGGSPGLASLLDRAEANSGGGDDEAEEPVVSKAEEPVVSKAEEPAEVSREPEPELEPETAPAADSGLLSKRLMELSSDDEEELEAAAASHGDEPERADDEKVFAENVDEEIDDIFTSLAPAEAQREVAEAGESEEEEPTEEDKAVAEEAAPEEEEVSLPEPETFEAKSDVLPEPEPEEEEPAASENLVEEPEAEPAEGLIFNQGVDDDIDDVFSNLAPAEAHRTIEDRKPAEEEAETAEPAQEEEAAEPEEGLVFTQGVDDDLDDVFSNLAPAEAQLNVGDVKLKKQEEEPALDQEATGDFIANAKAEAAEPEAEEEAEPEEEPLLKLDDSDVDDIFAGLAGEQLDVNAETLAKAKNKEAEEEAEVPIPASLVETGDRIPVITAESAQKTAKQTGDMPAMTKEQAAKIKDDVKKASEDDDDEGEDEESKEEAVPESPEAAKLKKELKEFGKLSGRSATAPKATGDSVGTMKTIGKLLIDNQAIENIIKAGEQRKLGQNLATARIISSARGQGIMELLHKIDKYEGVVGSIIVGHDGLVMASTLKEGWDKDIMGALSTALLSTSNLTTKKLEIGKLRQMIMLTKSGDQEKTTVLTDVDVGILAVFVEETDVSKIDGMLDIIHKTIHG